MHATHPHRKADIGLWYANTINTSCKIYIAKKTEQILTFYNTKHGAKHTNTKELYNEYKILMLIQYNI